jgi:hypothetical protein
MPEAHTFSQIGSTTTRHRHRDDDRISTAPPWAMAISDIHHQNNPLDRHHARGNVSALEIHLH